MAALACGTYVNVTMVTLTSHAQDEDSKYTCQEAAELVVSTTVGLSGNTDPPNTSILKVRKNTTIVFSSFMLKVLLTAAVTLSSVSDVGCSIVSTILHLLPQLTGICYMCRIVLYYKVIL